MRMSKTALFALLALGAALTASARPYRVATLPTWRNWGHNVQWNYIFEEAGWSYTNLLASAEAMDWLQDHLDEFDLLLGTQLFAYSKPGEKVPYDLGKYAKSVSDWVRRGGCVYLMDCNYAGAALDWFGQMDPSLACSAGDPKCDGLGPAVATEPIDPLLFFPNAAEYGFNWNHMTLPDEKASAWKVLARCQHGDPTLMAVRWGKGIMMLNSCTTYVREFLQNMKANRLFVELGLVVTGAESPLPKPGPNAYRVLCANTTGRAKTGRLTLRLTPILEEDAKGRPVRTGASAEYAAESTVPANSEGAFTLACAVRERGRCRAELVLTVDGVSGTCIDKTVDLPAFFTLEGTRYRNLLSVGRRFDDIAFRTSLWPEDDGSRKDFRVRITVRAPSGTRVAATPVVPVARGVGETPVRLPRTLKPGVYSAEAELFEGTSETPLATSGTSVEIVGDVPGAALYDEDATLLVDGEPFLPLGIYHVGANADGEWAKVADVGFNVFNVFSYRGTGALDALRELDVKTLWEQLPHRAADACRAQGTELQTNPSALFWYTVDEPAESAFPFVRSLNEAWHATDRDHPTFIVSYQPHHFARNARLSDVLAPDNYPYHTRKGDDSDVGSVAKTVARARAATRGTGPVVFVSQAFGHEPPDIWRNLSFQALCQGAKGLFWYAWRENATVGLKYSPALVAEVGTTVAELRALAPALLNAETPARGFTAAGGDLHGLVMTDPKTQARTLMLANASKRPLDCEIDLPELSQTNAAGRLDGGRYGSLAHAGGRVRVVLGRFGSGLYALDAPFPLPPAPDRARTGRKLPARGSGRTLRVSPDGASGEASGFGLFGGTRTFATLQAAFDAAEDGDVIEVAEGTYAPAACDNKLVDVVAVGATERTVVDAQGKGRALTLTRRPYGDMSKERNVRLVGLTVRGGKPSADDVRPTLGGAVLGGTLEGCVIADSTAAASISGASRPGASSATRPAGTAAARWESQTVCCARGTKANDRPYVLHVASGGNSGLASDVPGECQLFTGGWAMQSGLCLDLATDYEVDVNNPLRKWRVNDGPLWNTRDHVTFTAGSPLALCADHSLGAALDAGTQAGSLTSFLRGRLYFLRAYDADGALIHEFLPARDEQATDGAKQLGVYDTVGQKFWPNCGPMGFATDPSFFRPVVVSRADHASDEEAGAALALAVRNAFACDRIVLTSGTAAAPAVYRISEPLRLTTPMVCLAGSSDDPEATVIDAGHETAAVVVTAAATSCEVRGLTVRNAIGLVEGTTPCAGGIAALADGTLVSNCVVRACRNVGSEQPLRGSGVYLVGSSLVDSLVESCAATNLHLSAGTTDSYGGGVCAVKKSRVRGVEIRDCTGYNGQHADPSYETGQMYGAGLTLQGESSAEGCYVHHNEMCDDPGETCGAVNYGAGVALLDSSIANSRISANESVASFCGVFLGGRIRALRAVPSRATSSAASAAPCSGRASGRAMTTIRPSCATASSRAT